jgi:glycerophosphoryl diester phosphodiesterase
MQTFDDPLLNLGHRGASTVAPENTLASFRKALQLGADGVELDVQFSKDQQVLVIHDDFVNRTTDGEGKVSKQTLDHLKTLDAGLWFSPDFTGERLPTLAETLAFADGQLLLDIEIKKCRNPKRLAQAVVELLAPYDLDQYLITSFDQTTIEHVKVIQPRIRTGLLFERTMPGLWEGSWDFIIPNWTLIDEHLLWLAKDSGKKIVTWTVNGEINMKRLLAQGVGRIITNHPDRLNKVLSDHRNGLTKS